jgi:hypothetical protein
MTPPSSDPEAKPPRITVDTFAVGHRVLLTTMEVEGTITAIWEDGSAMLQTDDDVLIACGVKAMVHLVPQARP